MSNSAPTSEVNIHLRARSDDRDVIDQAATLVGANRSQFMLASALKEARNVLLDQTNITLDSARFQKVLAWLDSQPSEAETLGLKRLMSRKPVWIDE